ncbi:hypothetical protein GGH12_000232 [Coemansia sp. RSA 1822]|nr:hypothetical protein GGH12_000232 [Coemansia sp. RSA 1822]
MPTSGTTRKQTQAFIPSLSSSIAAEHIMRHQQQLASMGGEWQASPISRIFSPVSPSMSNGMDNEEFLVNVLSESPVLPSAVLSAGTAAFIASLSNTPVLQFASDGAVPAQSGIAAELSGLNLPDAMAGNTIHGGASHVGQHSRTLHQLIWLKQTSAPGPNAAPVMATPAMLMNLPVSAHHLPHTSYGEFITETSFQQHQQVGEPVPYSFDVSASVFALATQSAPMVKFIHPPAPPPLCIGPSVSTGPSIAIGNTHAFLPCSRSSSGDVPKRERRKSVSTASDLPNTAASQTSSVWARRGEPSRARRRSQATQLLSPRTTLLVPLILKGTHSPGFSPDIYTCAAPAMVAATSTTNIVRLEADVAIRLATKSNYQNSMKGNSELLGLAYRSKFMLGFERRHTNHKNAEQKRRDSLKMCFQNLRDRIPDVDPKLVSKIYLLGRVNAHIDALALVNQRLVKALQALGVMRMRLWQVQWRRLQSLNPCLSDGPDMDLDS